MLTIYWNNDCFIWRPDEYTDYDFIGDWFVVLKDKQWVGFYKTEHLEHVECRDSVIYSDDDGNRCVYD